MVVGRDWTRRTIQKTNWVYVQGKPESLTTFLEEY